MIKGLVVSLVLILILGLGAITLAEQPAGMMGPGMSGHEMMKQPEMMRQMSTMMENMQRMMKDMASMMGDMGRMMEECQKMMGPSMKPEKPAK